MRSVAEGLRQFDIDLDDIDIVSVKVRRGGNAAELSKLDDLGPGEWDLVSDQSASYVRRTWLVLRMNPQHNVAAVAARDSLASTLVAATERLAQDLDGPTCAARPLTADETRRGGRRRAGRSGTDVEPPRLAPPQAFQRLRDQLLVDAVGHHHGHAG